MWTEDEIGEAVRVAGLWDDEEEARFIGDEIEAWQHNGGQLSESAVLVRAGFQTRALEERFIAMGLPYRVIGGPRFYERLEIRDAIAYLRLICQSDDDLAFERICNTPRRGIGDAALKTLHASARAAGTSLYQTAHNLIATDELAKRTRTALKAFLDLVDLWRCNLTELEPRGTGRAGCWTRVAILRCGKMTKIPTARGGWTISRS